LDKNYNQFYLRFESLGYFGTLTNELCTIISNYECQLNEG
jgi:hypothetical protein